MNTIRNLIILTCLVLSQSLFAQLPTCNNTISTIIYLNDNATGNIYNYDVSMPLSATNPTLNTIPGQGFGLVVANNLNNSAGPSPTFYIVSGAGGNYMYWDGSAWVNTGHSAGPGSNYVNPGGAGNYIYNFNANGTITRYNGTGNASIILSVPSFMMNGPFDIMGHCDGGFYMLKTDTFTGSPGTYLRKYDSTGTLQQAWTTTGTTNSGGGGFAIVNNQIYYHNTGGLRSAPFTAPNTNLSFSPVLGNIPYPSDFAACPVCDSSLVTPPPPTADFAMSDDTICIGDCINFTDLSNDTPTAWMWSFQSGTPSTSNLQNPASVCFNSSGTFTIELIVSNAYGSDTATKNIVVYPTPLAIITGDTVICNGQATILSANPAGLKYLWSNSDTTQTTTIIPTTNSTVNLIVSNTHCADTISQNIIVVPQPTASITGPVEICLGESAVLSAFPIGINYLWDNNQTAQSITISPSTNTNYKVYTSIGNCIDSASHSISVNPLPIIDLIPTPTDCDQDNGSIISMVSAGTPSYSYLWSNNQNVPNATLLSQGIYTLIVSDSKNCKNSSSAAISTYPNPSASITPAPISIIDYGNSIQLLASGGINFSWTPSLSLSCNNCPNPIATPKDKTTFYCVEVTDEHGCKDTACTTIEVNYNCESIFIPNAFTPNADGLNDRIGIISNCKFDIFDFRIFNRWGQQVFRSNDIAQPWDGSFKNQIQPTSTFYYILKGKLINGENIYKIGDITLIK